MFLLPGENNFPAIRDAIGDVLSDLQKKNLNELVDHAQCALTASLIITVENCRAMLRHLEAIGQQGDKLSTDALGKLEYAYEEVKYALKSHRRIRAGN